MLDSIYHIALNCFEIADFATLLWLTLHLNLPTLEWLSRLSEARYWNFCHLFILYIGTGICNHLNGANRSHM